MKKIKVYFHTLGCKVNQYDTQLMIENLLLDERFEVTRKVDEADIFVINTCVVTEKAERESRKLIRKFSSKGKVVVTGCLPEKTKHYDSKITYLTLDEERNLRDIILSLLGEKEIVSNHTETITGFYGRTRAFVKVQEGCNRFCSYCIVAYLRGKVRSRKTEDIVREVRNLISNGYREIVLTGTQIGLYGYGENKNLVSLIREILKIPFNFRIRISSINPEFVDNSLIEVMEEEKVCPHLHLSLQSGSDKILKLMRRKYTIAEFLKKVETFKKKVKNASVTTDIIVGFPGEEEEDFKSTLKAVKEAGFVRVHIFPYSKREKTLAANFKNEIPKDIIKERERKLNEVVKEVVKDEIGKFLGKRLIVLNEKIKSGYTENYIRVILDKPSKVNQFYIAYLQNIKNGVVYGKIEKEFSYSPIEKGGENSECLQLKEEKERTSIA
ncbi:MAG: tRNA (N(6)-L-threonylcarbamoyladenosine(37)-C(2))-methylthiotransferase MtaB [Caldiserica bacterium]|nr:MAG: tRNA (N(6)-L-threonylcarbamoyladenosine(37)-C(2))-methylthiotransferase MtaB [Caldisericota bacterium]